MVAKDFERIIKEIKLEEEKFIHQKDIPSTHLDSLLSKNELKEKVENKINEVESILENKEIESSIKVTEESKNEKKKKKEQQKKS